MIGSCAAHTLQLIKASGNGDAEVAAKLIRKGASVNAQCGHLTALQAACSAGHVELVDLLIQSGANTNQADGVLLRIAATGGHEGVVDLLLDGNADVQRQMGDGSGRTALHSLVQSDCMARIAPLLLQHGAAVDQSSVVGSPLCWAASVGNDMSVKFLLKARAEVDLRVDSNTPLLGALIGMNTIPLDDFGVHVLHPCGYQQAIALRLINHKADVNSTNRKSDTPLTLAARNADVK